MVLEREYIIATKTCVACGYENDWTVNCCVKCYPDGVFGELKEFNKSAKLLFGVKDNEKEPG